MEEALGSQARSGAFGHMVAQCQGLLQKALQVRMVQVGPGQGLLGTALLGSCVPRPAGGAVHKVEGNVRPRIALHISTAFHSRISDVG